MEKDLRIGLRISSYDEFEARLVSKTLRGKINVFLPGGRTILKLLTNSAFMKFCKSSELYLTDERIVSVSDEGNNWRNFDDRELSVNGLVDVIEDDIVIQNYNRYFQALCDERNLNIAIVTFGYDGHYAGHVVGASANESILSFYETESGLMRVGLGNGAWTKMDFIYVFFDSKQKQKALQLEPLRSFIRRYADKIELVRI